MAFPTGWGMKCALVIQESKISDAGGDLSNFPVLLTKVNLPSAVNGMFDADGTNPALEGGGDIRFSSDSAGSSQLACEVVAFSLDDASDLAEIWVSVPTVDKDGDTTIYIWYNKGGESQPAVDAAFGREATWDANFISVWHLDDATTSAVNDSTGNNDGTKTGANEPVETATAKIYKAQDFDGSDDKIDFGDIDASEGIGALTISSWVYGDETAADYAGIVTKAANAASITSWSLMQRFADVRFSVSADSIIHATGTTDINDGWHYLVGVYDGSDVYIYIDGVSEQDNSLTGNIDTSAITVKIGMWNDAETDQYDQAFNGKIDEVRISSTNRSAEWIGACFENQDDPGGFVVEGTPESTVTDLSVSVSECE